MATVEGKRLASAVPENSGDQGKGCLASRSVSASSKTGPAEEGEGSPIGTATGSPAQKYGQPTVARRGSVGGASVLDGPYVTEKQPGVFVFVLNPPRFRW